MNSKWVRRFLDLAAHVAQWSKDPNTKVGAIAVNSESRHVLETGYNGLPRGVRDLPERMSRTPLPGHQTGAKYLFTAHAEENLVAHAARPILEGSTVYVTHFCCATCTRMLINSGVKRVIVGPGKTSMPAEQFEVARIMFDEAGVDVIFDENQGVD